LPSGLVLYFNENSSIVQKKVQNRTTKEIFNFLFEQRATCVLCGKAKNCGWEWSQTVALLPLFMFSSSLHIFLLKKKKPKKPLFSFKSFLLHSLQSLEKGSTMSNSLPNEVIAEILSRLPMKSVIKFRCVSKTWCSLISSPHFIATHLSRALSIPQYPSNLVFHHSDYPLKKDRSPAIGIHQLSPDPEIQERSLVTPQFDLDVRGDPSDFIGSRCLRDCMQVIGSSNGLFCLTRGFDSYVLCNPCIQKAVSIPHPNFGP